MQTKESLLAAFLAENDQMKEKLRAAFSTMDDFIVNFFAHRISELSHQAIDANAPDKVIIYMMAAVKFGEMIEEKEAG